MSDQIIQSTKCLNTDDSLCHWSFSYSVESGELGNQFRVIIEAGEMTDPTSASEAKTKANAKAAVIKNDWIGALAQAKQDIPGITEPENVTLP